jgi:AcrR family transcriptional regulator
MTTGRLGRRPGGPDTRGALLLAAREEFAAKGYDGATVRGIAARAGVDPALVHHYFGTKEALFTNAMQFPVEPAKLIPEILADGVDQAGERLVRTLLRIWGNPATREPALALVRSAVTHEAAASMLRQFASRALVRRVAAELDLPEAQLRVSLIASHIVGLALLRYVIRVEPLAGASDDDVVALVAPVLQRYLTGPVSPSGPVAP